MVLLPVVRARAPGGLRVQAYAAGGM